MKQNASTQKFIGISDIKETVVLLEQGSACTIIEVQAANFALLSPAEQQAKLFNYASLLNSLSSQIQILIRNKKVDISSYLKYIDTEIKQLSLQAPTSYQGKQQEYLHNYQEFIQALIKVNTVLDKRFYLVLSFSYLEKGANIRIDKTTFFDQAKVGLRTKAESLLTELSRLNLRAKVLEANELIKLFYDIYNQELPNGNHIEDTINPVLVQAQK